MRKLKGAKRSPTRKPARKLKPKPPVRHWMRLFTNAVYNGFDHAWEQASEWEVTHKKGKLRRCLEKCILAKIDVFMPRNCTESWATQDAKVDPQLRLSITGAVSVAVKLGVMSGVRGAFDSGANNSRDLMREIVTEHVADAINELFIYNVIETDDEDTSSESSSS